MAVGTQVGKGYVDIVPDMSGFQQDVTREVERTTSKASKIAGNALKFGGIASATITPAVLGGFKLAADAASDLNESVNAVDKSFGDASEGVQELGEQAARSIGLSNTDFNSLAVRFSSFAQTVAGEGGDVVGTLDDLTTRSADFASVMNLDVAEAATKFQSGLAGETEPLRQFGIDLSAAAVEAHALETGIIDSAGAMSESEKIQARYSLLMEETAQFAGDFAETSGDAANAQRIASAEWEDAAAKLGESLLPIMADAAGVAADVAGAFSELPDAVQNGILILGGVAAAAGPASIALGGTIKAVQGIKSAIGAMQAARAASTVANTAEGISAIGSNAAAGIPSLKKMAGGLGKVAGVAAGVWAVSAALDAAFGTDRDIAGTAAGLEVMAETGSSAQWDAATGGVDGLSESLDLLFAEDRWAGIRRGTLNIAGFIGVDELSEAEQSVDALDGALAGMVSSGNLDGFRAGFDQIVEAADRKGIAIDDVVASMPKLQDALAESGYELEDFTGATDNASGAVSGLNPLLEKNIEATGGLVKPADDAARAFEDINIEFRDLEGAAATVQDALSDLAGEFMDLTGGQRDVRAATAEWEASLDDLTASVKDNGTTLDLSTEKGRANEAMLSEAQRAAEDHAIAVLEETGSIDKANEALDQHRSDLYDAMIQAGFSEEAAAKYTEEIERIPDDAETRLRLEDAEARERLEGWIDELEAAPDYADTYARFFPDRDSLLGWLSDLEDINRTITTRGVFKSSGGASALHGGTDNWRGGPAIVNDAPGGTQGELINLPGGSSVTPSRDSVEMLAAAIRKAGGGGTTVNVYGDVTPKQEFRARQLIGAY